MAAKRAGSFGRRPSFRCVDYRRKVHLRCAEASGAEARTTIMGGLLPHGRRPALATTAQGTIGCMCVRGGAVATPPVEKGAADVMMSLTTGLDDVSGDTRQACPDDNLLRGIAAM